MFSTLQQGSKTAFINDQFRLRNVLERLSLGLSNLVNMRTVSNLYSM